MTLELQVQYRDHAALWTDELRDWVPDTIFDAHVHLGPPEAMREIPDPQRSAATSFNNLTWRQLESFYRELYSGKAVEGLIAFPFPLREVNYELANRYIAGLTRDDPRVHGFILSNPFDTRSTIAQFDEAAKQGARFRGVKPYYDLLGRDITNSVEVADTSDFVPDDLLEWMNSEHLIMMLHTCSIGMGDPECQRWVLRAVEKFPNIKIILAHMGRYFHKEQFFDFFHSGLMDHPSLYLETSDARIADVYAHVFTRPDWCKRLIFGSDVPYGLFICQAEDDDTAFLIPGQSLSGSAGRVAAAIEQPPTYNTYHVIKALKDALEATGWDEQRQAAMKADIFSNNVRGLLFEEESPGTTELAAVSQNGVSPKSGISRS